MPTAVRGVTLDDLMAVCRQVFASTSEDLIGLECEWPVRRIDDPLARPDLHVLQRMGDGPLPSAGIVTVEPGGQIELSSAPERSVGDAIRAVEADATTLHARLRDAGLEPDSVAVDAIRSPRRILDRPRYRAMEAHFDRSGAAGRWMMCNTASVQVNISNDPVDPFARWRVLNHIGPVLLAMFANSAARDAGKTTWASARQGIWWNIDASRTRPVAMTADPAADWLAYAMAAKVFFIQTQGPTSPCGVGVTTDMTFAEWFENGHLLGWPTVDDFRYHLTTLFPPVRPRGWVELRVLDALPPQVRGAAALAVATACADGVRDQVLATVPATDDLWMVAARDGLASRRLNTAAQVLASLVATGVPRVADTDHVELLRDFLDAYTRKGMTPGMHSWLPLPVSLAGPSAGTMLPMEESPVTAVQDDFVWTN
ncbi:MULTISPECIES: glutamate-cysteine ligase family protein [unclassified Nocardioides]|uniref:glutamate-cysteine ligase family protein n=1 Tax=unclassified Nocardioides TaxID=2615069 RepID=UPI0006F93DAA|nr:MULTISPECIES: glutamate-cysteine ligase family protein [unclassified Nocardioides]KRA29986.1 hypothetical protein ASD81_20050 [Nocardioides sp. Root614]KRA86907.1 hypothetical protein ASD84_22265 [Nocardioides sp. Root682]